MDGPYPERKSHWLFRMSPVLSGLVLHYFRSRHRVVGLDVANAWDSIRSCQHLYNALRQRKMLNCGWSDTDVLSNDISTGDFYVGKKLPTPPEDIYKNFSLRRGVASITLMDSKQRHGKSA
ncbi:hypothetical protein F5X98DRAFT_230789 [Xylaria grammica]|nr:hypothetical protein F5X98DRAFT_230789 [Xylaria grammica]